jgi:hypothetical protein
VADPLSTGSGPSGLGELGRALEGDWGLPSFSGSGYHFLVGPGTIREILCPLPIQEALPGDPEETLHHVVADLRPSQDPGVPLAAGTEAPSV